MSTEVADTVIPDNTPKGARIVFFGNERLASGVSTTAPTLRALLAAGYDVCAVVVAQNPSAASRKERKLEIAEVAEQHHIPLLSPLRPKEILQQLKDFNADAGVLVAYGKIVSQSVIAAFKHGIVNIHPSLLPKHRGPTPLESVILQDEKETGVSLMMLAAEMDAGPVYAQETIFLRGDETKQQLADQLLDIGKNMVIQYLPAILDGSLKPTSQNNDDATYDKLLTKDAGNLEWGVKSASEMERAVRAYHGWPRSRALIGTTTVIITKAHVIDVDGMPGTLYLSGLELGMHCKEGTLVIDSLIPTGRKEMSGSAFLAGYQAM